MKPNIFRQLWFRLRTGHRDPESYIDSFAKKQPKQGQTITEADIREAMKGMPEDLKL